MEGGDDVGDDERDKEGMEEGDDVGDDELDEEEGEGVRGYALCFGSDGKGFHNEKNPKPALVFLYRGAEN